MEDYSYLISTFLNNINVLFAIIIEKYFYSPTYRRLNKKNVLHFYLKLDFTYLHLLKYYIR